jgi:hypothetical protein
MSKESLIEELNSERKALYTVLHGLAEEDLRQPDAAGQYSIAEVCGLISAWESRLLTILQQISQGDPVRPRDAEIAGRPGDFYADAHADNALFNQTQSRRRSRWPWREILNELIWTREETGWTLANMPEEVCFTKYAVETAEQGAIYLCPADILRQIIAQDRQRAEEIQQWLRSRSSIFC